MLHKKFILEFLNGEGEIDSQDGESREELESLIPVLRDEGGEHFLITEIKI